MLSQPVEEAMSLYAFGSISEEDVCYLLGREEFFLTEEEATYVKDLEEDYEAWLIEQQMREYNAESND